MDSVLVIFNDKMPNESIFRQGGFTLAFGWRVQHTIAERQGSGGAGQLVTWNRDL